MPESDFSGSFISGYGSSPSRCGPSTRRTGWVANPEISRFPYKELPCMPGSQTTPGRLSTRITRSSVLPSGTSTPSAPEILDFRGSMAGLHAPLPTLRRHPRGGLRTARGRYGLLALYRNGLAPSTPCRSPGALTDPCRCESSGPRTVSCV
jgi:hypothetical protein